MRSTMMDVPLTVTSIMRYGTTNFRDKEVVTNTGEGVRRQTYGELARRAARLANALRQLGVDGDQRVATFMWNNAEHLEAYLAVPSMGDDDPACDRRRHARGRAGPGCGDAGRAGPRGAQV
jgi:fatty-acyl-CoA synthase